MTRSTKPFDESLWEASDGPRLVADLQEISHQIRLLEAQRLDIVAELDRQGIPALSGYPNTRSLVMAATRVAPKAATHLVNRARAVTDEAEARPCVAHRSQRAHCDVLAFRVRQTSDTDDQRVRIAGRALA